MEITDVYKTGDVFMCSGQRLVAKLIKKFTKSEFSHAGIYVEVWGKPYIIDSQKDGTNLRPFDEWVKMYNYKYRVFRSSNLVNEKTFAERALSKCGNTAYDFEGLIIRQPWELLTGNYRKPKDNEKMYCSEFVAWCYGVKESYRMSPQDLYEWIRKNYFYEIEIRTNSIA